jgi:hypothetical protein
MRPRRRFENCRTTIATVVIFAFILQWRNIAEYGGISRNMAEWRGLLFTKIPRTAACLCGIDLQCLVVGRP